MSGTREVVFSYSDFVMSLGKVLVYLLDSMAVVCATESGSGSQAKIEIIALKSRFVFHETPLSLCE